MTTTIAVDLNLIGTICAIASVIAVWIKASKENAKMEGRHQKEIEGIKEKVQKLEGELAGVQECNQTLDGAIIEIRTDVAWIKGAVSEIKETLALIGGGRRKSD